MGSDDDVVRTIGTDEVHTEGHAPTPPIAEVPVLDADEDAGATTTALDDIASELAGELEDKGITLPVPGRAGYELTFSTALTDEVLSKLRKASRDKTMPEGINQLALGCRVLAFLNTGIVRQGEPITSGGEPLTVRHKPVLDLYQVGRAIEAIRKLYGRDGHVIAAARRLLEACGYDEDALDQEADPTKGP